VMGSALDWIRSYLDDRSTLVRWKQISSDVFPFNTGVPQGSSLRPLLFSMYVAPLLAVINLFTVSHHRYADDTRIYVTVSKADLSDKVGLLQDYTAGVHWWLKMNGLQINPIKSEAIQFMVTRRRDKVVDVTSVLVSKAIIKPVLSIRSFGVTLDRKLSFDQHVNNTCRSCYMPCDISVSHCLKKSSRPSLAV